MPMPTTKRGRFLLYKARQRRRIKHVYNRAKRYTGSVWTLNRATSRRYVWSGLTKQMPRVYPQHFPEKSMTAGEWFLAGYFPPSLGVWGIAMGATPLPQHLPAADPRNGATTNYWDRRVKSIPRIHLLTLGAYTQTKAAVTPAMAYPFPAYPSGRVSYARLQGWV